MTEWIAPSATWFSAVMTATIATVSIWRSLAPRETRLKHDLEVLKLARDAGLHHAALEASILRRLQAVYPETATSTPPEDLKDQLRRARSATLLDYCGAVVAALIVPVQVFGAYTNWRDGDFVWCVVVAVAGVCYGIAARVAYAAARVDGREWRRLRTMLKTANDRNRRQ